jgi:hypothetical protein
MSQLYEPTVDEVSEQFSMLHNEELRHLYRSPSIVMILKYRRLGWVCR